jgi:hypothetical protein
VGFVPVRPFYSLLLLWVRVHEPIESSRSLHKVWALTPWLCSPRKSRGIHQMDRREARLGSHEVFYMSQKSPKMLHVWSIFKNGEKKRQRQAGFWVRGQPGLQSDKVSSRTARATQRNPVSKNKTKQNKTKTKKQKTKNKKQKKRGWWDGSVVKSTRLLFRRSWAQIPATTWWLTTICKGIWCPLLEWLKTATVYSHIIK